MINVIKKLTNNTDTEIRSRGVYTIVFGHNAKKIYVGSTFSKHGFYRRWYQHITELRRGRHYCKHLQSIFNKYGEGNFIFSIIEFTDDKKTTYEKEKHHIDVLKNTFTLVNTVQEAYSMRNYVPSQRQRKILSERLRGKRAYDNTKPINQYSLEGVLIKKWGSFKELCDCYNRGRNYFYFRGNYKCFSDFVLIKNDEEYKNICESCNGKYTKQKKKVFQYDLNGNLVRVWNSGREAEKYYNVGKGNVSQAVSGAIKTLKGFIWKR